MIAIPLAGFTRPRAMIARQAVQTSCNDLGHDAQMIAIPSADDCGSLQIFRPQHSSEFDYIEIGGVLTDTRLIGTKLQGHDAPSRAKYIVHKGDVITSTVRPLRKLSGIVGSDQDGWVCSSGFAVLQPMKVPAEYLVAYLRLAPVCELMDAHTTASMYPALSVSNLLNLPISVPPEGVVEGVCEAVRKVRGAREAANSDVAKAKRIVERALSVHLETA